MLVLRTSRSSLGPPNGPRLSSGADTHRRYGDGDYHRTRQGPNAIRPTTGGRQLQVLGASVGAVVSSCQSAALPVLLSKRSAKSSRSCVSACSCWRPWTTRSSASSRALTSGDDDSRRVAHRRATLTIVTAAVPTTVMSATRNTAGDRKSTRLNSSHTVISYAVFCLKKKKKENN